MKKYRYISCQVLLNKDGSVKARRFYAIPEPAIVTIYLEAQEKARDGKFVDIILGVLFQDWNNRDILAEMPPMSDFWQVMENHFGIFEGAIF